MRKANGRTTWPDTFCYELTDQGVKTSGKARRASTAPRRCQRKWLRNTGILFDHGVNDMCTILEAPDRATLAKFNLTWHGRQCDAPTTPKAFPRTLPQDHWRLVTAAAKGVNHLAFVSPKLRYTPSGWLAADVPLANRVRSGRSSPNEIGTVPVQPPPSSILSHHDGQHQTNESSGYRVLARKYLRRIR